MKKLIASIATIVIISVAFVSNEEIKPVLEIGVKAPMQEHKMKDVSGKEVSFKDIMNKNGLLVIFSCNTCPFVVGRDAGSVGWEGRYNDVASRAIEMGVSTILVNSNEAKREKDDSYDAMIKRAEDQKYTMSYVVDKNHLVADAFGARTTPHVYLFNNEFELVYKGAIDDNNDNPKEVEQTWLLDALKNLASGDDIDPNSTRNIGCSIKRVKKS